jgi:RNA polymerase sigma-70 factor (ECF subfamily)
VVLPLNAVGPTLATKAQMQFQEVYDAEFAFVWRSLRRLGVAEANLKDALQDVFIVVHRRLPDFVERAKVTTWLFRICAHIAKDYRRRAHVRHEVLVEQDDVRPEQALGAVALDAEQELLRREDLELFEAALAKLDLDQRMVFMLFELEDLTGEQIADTLEIPLGTVYSRLRLARQAFRRAVVQQAAARRAIRSRAEQAS